MTNQYEKLLKSDWSESILFGYSEVAWKVFFFFFPSLEAREASGRLFCTVTFPFIRIMGPFSTKIC